MSCSEGMDQPTRQQNYDDHDSDSDIDDWPLNEPEKHTQNKPPEIKIQLDTNETVLTPRPSSDNQQGKRQNVYNQDPISGQLPGTSHNQFYNDWERSYQRGTQVNGNLNIQLSPRPNQAHIPNNINNTDNAVVNGNTPLLPSTWTGDQGNSGRAERGVSHSILVDLTSNAFTLDRRIIERGGNGRGMTVQEMILSKFVQAFGIEQEDLRFYELREVAVENIPNDCWHVGVAVKRSGFSLSAMEEILQDNRRLQNLAEKSNQAYENLQADFQQQSQELTRSQLSCAQHEAELKRLKVVVSKIEQENLMVRKQLQRSEDLRLQAQRALDDLKKEFESFANDLALRPTRSSDTQRLEGLVRSFQKPQEVIMQSMASSSEESMSAAAAITNYGNGPLSSTHRAAGILYSVRSNSPPNASNSQHIQQQQQQLQQQQQRQLATQPQVLQQTQQQQHRLPPGAEQRAGRLLELLLERFSDEQFCQRLEQTLGSLGAANGDQQ